jgi:hypothetical protein
MESHWEDNYDEASPEPVRRTATAQRNPHIIVGDMLLLQGGRGLLIVAMPVGFHHLIVRLVLLSCQGEQAYSKARGAQ